MKKVFSILVILLATNAGFSQSSWTFVGPYSENNISGNGFQTGRVDFVEVDPNDQSHVFCGGPTTGLWESTDGGATWPVISTKITPNIDISYIGTAGVSCIKFKSSTEIYVASHHEKPSRSYCWENNPCYNYSNGLFIYNFSTQSWTTLGQIIASQFVIYCIAINPANSSELYVGTSVGLFKSTNGGTSWTSILSNPTYGVEFVLKTSPASGYFMYVSGSTAGGAAGPTGNPFLKESSNFGVTYTDLSSNLPNVTSIGMALLYQGTTSGSTTDIFTYSNASSVKINKFVINNSSLSGGFQSVSLLLTPSNTSYDRSAFKYDVFNNSIWYSSGTTLSCYKFSTSSSVGVTAGTVTGQSGAIHSDIHGFSIQNTGSNKYLFVASDGGLGKADITTLASSSPVTTFTASNDGLHVSKVNGFSGSAEDPDMYALGYQDIITSDVYDASLSKNKYTFISGTWENDGALIDKFNKDFMIFDASSYNTSYLLYEEGVTTNPYSVANTYNAQSASTFEADLTSVYAVTAEFAGQRYVQDPYRPGRIFGIGNKKWPNFTQMDMDAQPNPPNPPQRFVRKMEFDNSNYPGASYEQLVNSLSFSPQTKNSLYVTLNSRYVPVLTGENWPSRVFKYIGDDIDNCWVGHYQHLTPASNPQWLDITPDYLNLSSIGGGASNVGSSEVGASTLFDIQTSPWNKDVVYVGCEIVKNPNVKVIKYNGTAWTNYSTGIPNTEIARSLIMDRASDDGLYLTTDRAVYFRDGTMSSWVSYNTDLPNAFTTQVEINYKENTMRCSLYGLGIWKSPLACPAQSVVTLNTGNPILAKVTEGYTITANSAAPSTLPSPTVLRASNGVILNPGFYTAISSNPNTYFMAFIHGCAGSNTGTSNYLYYRNSGNSGYDLTGLSISGDKEEEEEGAEVYLYPNPSKGLFIIESKEEMSFSFEIYDVLGNKIRSMTHSGRRTELDLSQNPKGLYLITCIINGQKTNKRIIIE